MLFLARPLFPGVVCASAIDSIRDWHQQLQATTSAPKRRGEGPAGKPPAVAVGGVRYNV